MLVKRVRGRKALMSVYLLTKTDFLYIKNLHIIKLPVYCFDILVYEVILFYNVLHVSILLFKPCTYTNNYLLVPREELLVNICCFTFTVIEPFQLSQPLSRKIPLPDPVIYIKKAILFLTSILMYNFHDIIFINFFIHDELESLVNNQIK